MPATALTMAAHEEISRGLVDDTFTAITGQIGRHKSTVSREASSPAAEEALAESIDLTGQTLTPDRGYGDTDTFPDDDKFDIHPGAIPKKGKPSKDRRATQTTRRFRSLPSGAPDQRDASHAPVPVCGWAYSASICGLGTAYGAGSIRVPRPRTTCLQRSPRRNRPDLHPSAEIRAREPVY